MINCRNHDPLSLENPILFFSWETIVIVSFQMEDPDGEGIRQLEDHLKLELLELRNEIEENDLVHGIPSKGMRYECFHYYALDGDSPPRIRSLNSFWFNWFHFFFNNTSSWMSDFLFVWNIVQCTQCWIQYNRCIRISTMHLYVTNIFGCYTIEVS